jgi:hypothetical protein
MSEYKFGDIVRAKCTAPARYIDDGLCMVVSSMSNQLFVDEVKEHWQSEEHKDPIVPTDQELLGANAMRRYFQVKLSS